MKTWCISHPWLAFSAVVSAVISFSAVACVLAVCVVQMATVQIQADTIRAVNHCHDHADGDGI